MKDPAPATLPVEAGASVAPTPAPGLTAVAPPREIAAGSESTTAEPAGSRSVGENLKWGRGVRTGRVGELVRGPGCFAVDGGMVVQRNAIHS